MNVARLLQSLDQDAAPANGIVITAAMHTALTGSGALINFDQTASAFAGDSTVQDLIDTLAPFTDAGAITLRSEQETIEHLAAELKIEIIQSDVSGNYETQWADAPAPVITYQFSAGLSGSVDNGTTTDNITWQIDPQNRLLVTIAGAAGLPQRFTLIQGTLDDGVLTAEVDEDQDGQYERFTLVTITAVAGPPTDFVILCEVTFDPDASANLALHSLQFPIDSNWNFEPYSGSSANAEYLTFTPETYNDIPSIRVDTHGAADDALTESLWLALGTDGAIYDLNHQDDEGNEYPCSTPRIRFPATMTAGSPWPVEVEGNQGEAEIVSTTAESPAGYTNTIKISITFDFGGTMVVYDNYYRVGQGLLDKSDNMSEWLKRADITPENPLPPAGGEIGVFTLSSATLPQDNGSFTMESSINSANTSISWTGNGITVVVATSLGTVSLSGASGTAYACACQPVLDFDNMTATFTDIVVTDTFPFSPGPETNSVTIDGALVIPAAN
jgi:hypothetical protein